jgi:hypothetical protein
VTQNCKSSAFLPFDQSADHSSVPANFRTPCRRLVTGGDRQRFALDGRGRHYGSLANSQVDARPIGPYTAGQATCSWALPEESDRNDPNRASSQPVAGYRVL